MVHRYAKAGIAVAMSVSSFVTAVELEYRNSLEKTSIAAYQSQFPLIVEQQSAMQKTLAARSKECLGPESCFDLERTLHASLDEIQARPGYDVQLAAYEASKDYVSAARKRKSGSAGILSVAALFFAWGAYRVGRRRNTEGRLSPVTG